MDLSNHYKILLQLDENWSVDTLEFDHEKASVIVSLSYTGQCQDGTIYDYRPLRRWRHLDTLQYSTYIEAKVPRVKDKEGKIRTLEVPWADVLQRHSHLLEKK